MLKSPLSLDQTEPLNDFSQGECPACLPSGISSPLKLNADDFWECPNCHLQAHTLFRDELGIIADRGTGDFRQNPERFLPRHQRIVVRDQKPFGLGMFSR